MPPTSEQRIWPGLKIVYTLFVVVLVPSYWVWRGPDNFLWASDIALIATVYALWREDALVASVMAVGSVLPDLVWCLDYLTHLVADHDVLGFNATTYMFDTETPWPIRGLSLFHLFLPFTLLWVVYRLGYDRRALTFELVLTWVVLAASYWISSPVDNINWVYGFGTVPQTWMPPLLYLLLLMLGFPLLVFIPSHLLLCRLFPPPRNAESGLGTSVQRTAGAE
jgi:hypothetical protein